jgi:hypothetical protein
MATWCGRSPISRRPATVRRILLVAALLSPYMARMLEVRLPLERKARVDLG